MTMTLFYGLLLFGLNEIVILKYFKISCDNKRTHRQVDTATQMFLFFFIVLLLLSTAGPWQARLSLLLLNLQETS